MREKTRPEADGRHAGDRFGRAPAPLREDPFALRADDPAGRDAGSVEGARPAQASLLGERSASQTGRPADAGSALPSILIAEDNPTNMLILRHMLEEVGYVPILAVDGFEAVELALDHRPRLILMDIIMPRMNGIAAAREIWKRVQWTRPRIIAVTGSTSDEQRKQCLEAGFDAVITKPFAQGELFAIIEKLL